LLESLAASLAVPQGVIREIGAGGASDLSAVATVTWAEARAVADVPLPASVAHWDLGAGESQVIAHCLASDSVAVLDDGEARACAQSHGLPLIGTLGIILLARKHGLIPAARPLVDQLLAAGSHLSRELVEKALALVGE
jgi:predicted nucleic acid-binding protein